MRPARFAPASDQSLLVYLGDSIAPETSARVLKLLRLLQGEPLAHVRNLHPAYASLLLKFDPLKTTHAALEADLHKYVDRLDSVPLPPPLTIEIPVCYGAEFGPDLADLAALHNLAAEQVIETHTSADYSVCFLGFVPGFAYLSGLPASLATPRLPSPRKQIPEGSVGIGGQQTGVYPFATPGGWQIIGRTPLKMFRPERTATEMCLLSIGDRVRFTSISRAQFTALEKT